MDYSKSFFRTSQIFFSIPKEDNKAGNVEKPNVTKKYGTFCEKTIVYRKRGSLQFKHSTNMRS